MRHLLDKTKDELSLAWNSYQNGSDGLAFEHLHSAVTELVRQFEILHKEVGEHVHPRADYKP